MAAERNAEEGGTQVALHSYVLHMCREGAAGVSVCARSTGHAPAWPQLACLR